LHDRDGFVDGSYPEFVNQINQRKAGTFEVARPDQSKLDYHTRIKSGIGMASAPGLGDAELAFEMAEVFSMAIVRDIPFCKFEDEHYRDKNTGLGVPDIVDQLNSIWSRLPAGDTAFTKRRYAARVGDPGIAYDVDSGDTILTQPAISARRLFRGSGPGAKAGPWVSQFMLVGNGAADMQQLGKSGVSKETCSINHDEASQRGYISYGSQVIDQRCNVFVPHLDYMLSWASWLDVQKGADVRGEYQMSRGRRFLSTPRDMATYVRFDALYQAYLNACLILLALKTDTQKGFPERSGQSREPRSLIFIAVRDQSELQGCLALHTQRLKVRSLLKTSVQKPAMH